MRPLLPTLLALLALAACGPTETELAYRGASARPLAGHPTIALVRVSDPRASDRWVGAVMGIDGKPLKRIETPGPTGEQVAEAFRTALRERGDLAPPGLGRYDLDITILSLDARQWAERQSGADLLVRLVDRRSGRVAYSARSYVESRGDNFLAMDNFAFGSPSKLAAIADATLSRTIDQTLDREGFASALATQSGASPRR
ncbi:MAG: hypothetical protein FWD12_03885 [Alphaproteobacteria bacterium]|nr:hypothetical protein [Alphaproteobacteria bacterium]